jgi:hypothetical protein
MISDDIRWHLVHTPVEMARAESRTRTAKAMLSERITVNFSTEQKRQLEEIADKNHVGFGWVVRHACDDLISRVEGGQALLPLQMD